MTNHASSVLVRLPAIAVLCAAITATAAPDANSCRDLYRMTDVHHAIEPGISVAATDALPAHCRVRGVINRAIRFEVTLPEEWNGRLMFEAVGGLAGVIGDTTSLLARGFARRPPTPATNSPRATPSCSSRRR